MSRIYLSPPHMSGDERRMLLDAFDSGWIAPIGPHVDGFEAEMGARIGLDAVLALSSGTAALHLGLLEFGVVPGDVVLCSSFTFVASANVIRYVGAEPVFIDCDAANWCIDPALVEEAILKERAAGRRVSAVVAVDLYGNMPDYERLESVCRTHGVPLLEDAAEALGSSFDGRAAGTFGEAGIFSFNGNKIITTSGGGMLVSSNADLVAHARYLSTQAREPVAHYQHRSIGYNYRLSNLLAAVGRGQLGRLDELVALRRRNNDHYQAAFDHLPVRFMPITPRVQCNHWLTTLTLSDPNMEPESVRLALETENIESRSLWKPLHLQPVFETCRMYGGAVSENLFATGLCLPSGSSLTEDSLARVSDAFERTLTR